MNEDDIDDEEWGNPDSVLDPIDAQIDALHAQGIKTNPRRRVTLYYIAFLTSQENGGALDSEIMQRTHQSASAVQSVCKWLADHNLIHQEDGSERWIANVPMKFPDDVGYHPPAAPTQPDEP